MANIRILGFFIRSSTKIEISFTSDLDTGIGLGNISINAAGSTTNSLTLKSISISKNVLTINTRPMVPQALYELILQSTDTQSFRGSKNEKLIEDGKTNHIFFVGIEEDDSIRDNILAGIESQQIYSTENSLIKDVISTIAKPINQTRNAAGEARAEKFISVTVEDEEITRGAGPTDRFSNESVYKLLRVGRNSTNANIKETITFSDFPSDPISLQQIRTTEIVSNTENLSNEFTGLIITVSKNNVIKLESLILIRDSTEYTYNIDSYRYGLKESKFDTNNTYSALNLNSNQIQLSNSAIGPSFPLPQGSDSIRLTYLYKKSGRIIDSDSVSVTSIIPVTREQIPAVATSFFLNNAPIVDSKGKDLTIGGITWLDPAQNFNTSVKHSAFVIEIPFNESVLPNRPGEWTINYSTGRVVVAGVDGTGTDGTTTIPPVASYNYKKTYQNLLDYNYFSDLNEIASVPDKNLDESIYDSTITFEYEDTFAEKDDFLFSSHVEKLEERVKNRVISNIGIKTLNGPITNVFRIFNETTGEIYTTSRINGNKIYFNATNPPILIDVNKERAELNTITQDQIVVTDTLSIVGKSFSAFKIELTKNKIASATGDSIGANFNTSLDFSDKTIFTKELFYDENDTLNENLIRLNQVGDYVVDYNFGIVYVAVNANASTAVGDVNYKYGEIFTRNAHITSVNNVFRSPNPVTTESVKIFSIGNIGDQTIELLNLEKAAERFDANGNAITVFNHNGNNAISTKLDPKTVRGIFQVTDLQLSYNPINFSAGATIQASNGYIILNPLGVPVVEENLKIKEGGLRRYVEVEKINNIKSGLTLLATLATNPTDSTFLKRNYAIIDETNGVNYFSLGADGYVDTINNRIVLPSIISSSYVGKDIYAKYRVKLISGAAVAVDYTPGDIFVDYTYLRDEILVSYEYGDNVIDWSISDSLEENDTYYVSYKYGALREALRDNFGVLTSIDELSTIPTNLDRETYRSATQGALQSFLKGPTIPSIKEIVSSITHVDPEITESVFQEWVLGRDHLNLLKMTAGGIAGEVDPPGFVSGKFENGILIDTEGQRLTIPATSNLRFSEGTWEAFVIPNWAGIQNDASLTFDLKFENQRNVNKIFLGSSNLHPEEIPFTINRSSKEILGQPTLLKDDIGFFLWFDTTLNKWRLRTRAPISESRQFSGTVTTTGQFNDVKNAISIDGYEGESGPAINEINDFITSTDSKIDFNFIVDGYDIINIAFDSYAGGGFAGYDGIDFLSDNLHYFFDTSAESLSKNRMALYKDGKGFLRFKVWDSNGRIKNVSANIKDWDLNSTHHIATSWKIGTIEKKDELHLFVDGKEVPNTYRFSGQLSPSSGDLYMDRADEILISSASKPILGGFDMVTTQGSSYVKSLSHDFISEGILPGDKFVILDNTIDGVLTQASPYVYVRNIVSSHIINLETKNNESDPVGSGSLFLLNLSLTNVKYSINQQSIFTSSDPDIEKIRIFSTLGSEIELFSPNTINPDYTFDRDGYQDIVIINNGVRQGASVSLRTYGLTQQRCIQRVYIWPDLTTSQKTNIIKTIMPQPTLVSKIKITAIISQRTNIETGSFGIVATIVGGHLVQLLSSNLLFCQPTDRIRGRRLKITINGDNFNFSGVNELTIVGNTFDGANIEKILFSETGSQITSKYFTSITNIVANFTPQDISSPVGSIEVREFKSITESENNGNYAIVRLSIEEQVGSNGIINIGQNTLKDGYARFGADDIGKTIRISSPISTIRTITGIVLTGSEKDSNTIILSGSTWAISSSSVSWTMLNTSYSDSGFSNGLITLETAGSGGLPFYLTNCWYEVDFPAYLQIPWEKTSKTLFIGSDINAKNQASAIIDDLRILSEKSDDTGRGAILNSSGRSITTDANTVRELSITSQTLALFKFNNTLDNSANFVSSFSQDIFQSEESVNSQFGQSAVFDRKDGQLNIDNQAVFQNNEGTIEFWVSPLIDTYNDPTNRYYIDLSSEQISQGNVLSPLTVRLSTRARNIISVKISNSEVNYFSGGSLAEDGLTITLGQPLPNNIKTVSVTFTPITTQGDRFSILKDSNNKLQLFVSASGVEYQISMPVYWKRNTWHRIYAAWDLNNTDNRDRLVFLVDGVERGIIKYGTGLLYGTGVKYAMPTIFGTSDIGTTISRNILADINLTDFFNTVFIGGDYTGQYPALAKMDNIRFSNSFRSIRYLGGSGPGSLLGQDLLFTSNTNTANPVVSDALTTLLLDFNNIPSLVKLAQVRNEATGIFDFFVKVFDSFDLTNDDIKTLIEKLIKRLKPAHTRAFLTYIDD